MAEKLIVRFHPAIWSKIRSCRRGGVFQPLTLDECRMAVRAIQVAMLMQPENAERLQKHRDNFAALVRLKRNRMREGRDDSDAPT